METVTEKLSNFADKINSSSNDKYPEGPVAKGIEQQTKKIPSDWFLWAGLGSIVLSATFHLLGKKEESNFVGHWAPTILILGLYNKLVKVAGSDGKGNVPEQGVNPQYWGGR
jgi:hypothetical protein